MFRCWHCYVGTQVLREYMGQVDAKCPCNYKDIQEPWLGSMWLYVCDCEGLGTHSGQRWVGQYVTAEV